MHGLLIKHHVISKTLSYDLACHIQMHAGQEKIAIVTNKPVGLLAITKKQWAILIRQVRRERSSTLDSIRIAGLTRQLEWMQGLTFSAKPLDDLLEADITFATAENFVCVPPVCPTIYVTYEFEKEKLHMLTSWMPPGSVVVIYEQG